MVDDAAAEVERLRTELEAHRQRELAELRAALSTAREEAAHFRAEAERTAEVGRKIYEKYRDEVAELKAKIRSLTSAQTYARRFGQH